MNGFYENFVFFKGSSSSDSEVTTSPSDNSSSFVRHDNSCVVRVQYESILNIRDQQTWIESSPLFRTQVRLLIESVSLVVPPLVPCDLWDRHLREVSHGMCIKSLHQGPEIIELQFYSISLF